MRALLLDLDDTLYDYAPAEAAARSALFEAIAAELSVPVADVEARFDAARRAVKRRLGPQGASHSRLLYLLEFAHQGVAEPFPIGLVREWERLFWDVFVASAELRAGATQLLRGWRAMGNRTAIVTDLVASVQLLKLERWSLLEWVDAVVVSEEVREDKPCTAAFELAMERLGVHKNQCVVVGDSDPKDGAAARALGVPYFRVTGSTGGSEGLNLIEVAALLGVQP